MPETTPEDHERARPVAWCGEHDKRLFFTPFPVKAEKWREAGWVVTPLYDATALAAEREQTVEACAALIERPRCRTWSPAEAANQIRQHLKDGRLEVIDLLSPKDRDERRAAAAKFAEKRAADLAGGRGDGNP